eukprot:CAMPEP_0179043948 /NCGR_PEP_ID=MMETSP0796-20121207/17422_1 /TAXON_ID=73915 /ORGANISM="Pyrodinium bahamense, Strain pbaha01" /LENGTH=320 /DNA_ID=CAMNT_0020740333 /DNA_START=63 /DNA_END=1023 /DNA_ORIENTATION=-
MGGTWMHLLATCCIVAALGSPEPDAAAWVQMAPARHQHAAAFYTDNQGCCGFEKTNRPGKFQCGGCGHDKQGWCNNEERCLNECTGDGPTKWLKNKPQPLCSTQYLGACRWGVAPPDCGSDSTGWCNGNEAACAQCAADTSPNANVRWDPAALKPACTGKKGACVWGGGAPNCNDHNNGWCNENQQNCEGECHGEWRPDLNTPGAPGFSGHAVGAVMTRAAVAMMVQVGATSLKRIARSAAAVASGTRQRTGQRAAESECRGQHGGGDPLITAKLRSAQPGTLRRESHTLPLMGSQWTAIASAVIVSSDDPLHACVLGVA